ncbi:SOS response-associated peptidase family protein [Xanthomonas campestris pv. campestris]|nr:SOS response-associated peptidase family protein [Xanthomonas campestris pv. campestris]
MCYSAQIRADFKKLVRNYGAIMSIKEFAELYLFDAGKARPNTPKGMDDAFVGADDPEVHAIAAAVAQWRAVEASKLEEELFAQKTRLVGAERALQTKVTKKAQNDVRVATNKIERARAKLSDLKRLEPLPRDARVFPGVYAPVIVMEGGQRVIKPMRYQCRLCGKPANYDVRFPGTYNARRDNLEGFWGQAFGRNHGVIIVDAFYENVARHAMEGRALGAGEQEENVVLEFRPQPAQEMVIACLWSEWDGPEGRLLSFAAITDDPPAEVAAAGHDRCIVQIKPENIDAWLNPDPANLAASYAVLDERPRPYYEHQLAA